MAIRHHISKFEQLAEHKFTLTVIQNMHPLIESTEPKLLQAIEDGQFAPRLSSRGEITLDKPDLWREKSSEAEKTYLADVALCLAKLIGAVERLEEVEIYLLEFPQPRTYEKSGITEDKWIHYHYSNYFLTMVSIYDIALILTNVVFLLKIDPRKCNDKNILRNELVKGTVVNETLRKLREIIRVYREPRNLFVHRNELPTIKSLELLEIISFQQRLGASYLSTKHLDSLYETARRNLVADLSMETEKAINGLAEFFDSLVPVYTQYAQNFTG